MKKGYTNLIITYPLHQNVSQQTKKKNHIKIFMIYINKFFFHTFKLWLLHFSKEKPKNEQVNAVIWNSMDRHV